MGARKVNIKIETMDSVELKNVDKLLEQIGKLEEEHNCDCTLQIEIKIADQVGTISIEDLAQKLKYYSSTRRRVSNS